MPDSGDRVYPPTGKLREWYTLPPRQWNHVLCDNVHNEFALPGFTVVDHDRLHRTQSSRALPQRAGRQKRLVAQAPFAVHDDDLAIASQPVVLQAVIRDNNICALKQRDTRCFRPICAHDYRDFGSPRDKQRFVTYIRRITVGSCVPDTVKLAATVTTADNRRLQSFRCKAFCQPDHQRRFSCSTYGQITDDDYRRRYSYLPQKSGSIELSTAPDDETKEPGKWQQQNPPVRIAIPDFVQPVMKSHRIGQQTLVACSRRSGVELQAVKASVMPVKLQQVVVRAELDRPALVKNQDFVGILNS